MCIAQTLRVDTLDNGCSIGEVHDAPERNAVDLMLTCSLKACVQFVSEYKIPKDQSYSIPQFTILIQTPEMHVTLSESYAARLELGG